MYNLFWKCLTGNHWNFTGLNYQLVYIDTYDIQNYRTRVTFYLFIHGVSAWSKSRYNTFK